MRSEAEVRYAVDQLNREMSDLCEIDDEKVSLDLLMETKRALDAMLWVLGEPSDFAKDFDVEPRTRKVPV